VRYWEGRISDCQALICSLFLPRYLPQPDLFISGRRCDVRFWWCFGLGKLYAYPPFNRGRLLGGEARLICYLTADLSCVGIRKRIGWLRRNSTSLE